MQARKDEDGAWIGRSIGRRAWLGLVASATIAARSPLLRAAPPKVGSLSPEDTRAVEAVRARALKVQLGPIEVRWTDHFVGVGDAPPRDYIDQALLRCEAFAKDFLDHFGKIGFKLRYPTQRMVVVAMKDADSYQAYSGEERGAAVGGHYDLGDNQLVVFDFRANQAQLAAGAKRINTFTLIHEAAHMLCYNTGLLTNVRDIPDAISEGLATYAEIWTPPRPREHSAIGRVNLPRLNVFLQDDARWISVERLLADDAVFQDEATVDVAYAESWLLVHSLLRRPESVARFRAYLAGLPGLDSKVDRKEYAASKLGSLNELDAEMRRNGRRMTSRRR